MAQAINQSQGTLNNINPVNSETDVNIGISFVKHIFYIILCVILSFGIYYLEEEISLQQNLNQQNLNSFLSVEGNNRVELVRADSEIAEKFQGKIRLNEGDTIKTNASSNVSIFFPQESAIRLDENTHIAIKTIDQENQNYSIELLKGQAWVNTLFNPSKIEIETGQLTLEPIQAVFSVHKLASKVNVHVQQHQLKATVHAQNGELINEFYIAEGNKITANLRKIDNRLEELFYSKLLKEFKYGIFNKEINKTDAWFKQNLDKDRKYIDKISERELEKISRSSLNNNSIESLGFEFKNLFNENIKLLLTISPDKKEAIFSKALFGHLDDAIYLAEEGQIKEALKRLEYFDLIKNDLKFSTEIQDQTRKKELEKRINQLFFISPGDDLYVIKEYILSERLNTPEQEKKTYFPFLQSYLNDVYDAANNNFEQSSFVLESYFETIFSLLNSNTSIFGNYSKDLQIQNHFIDNLFLRYPTFYQSQFFQYKSKLEQLFLDTMAEGNTKTEERQSLISTKFDILKRLQYFFFEEEIALIEAREIVEILIEDITQLLPANSSKLAIQELFQKRIEDFNLFKEYLNNDEYAASVQHGATHRERYDKFLIHLEEIKALKTLKEDLYDSITAIETEAAKISKEDIIKKVKRDFLEINATEISFDDSLQDGDRYVRIKKATLEGYKIEGVYDTDKELISDLKVGGNIISSSGVKLNKILPLIESKFAKLKDNTETEIESSNESSSSTNKAHKLLKLLFIKKLEAFEIEIQEDQIEILDAEKRSFAAIGLEVPSSPEALYQFDVIGNDDQATNIKIITLKHEVNINEEIELGNLESKVKAAYSKYLEQIEEEENGLNKAKTPVKRNRGN